MSQMSNSERVIDVPDHILGYGGNVVFFVNSKGDFFDEGAKILQKQKKIPGESNMLIDEKHEFPKQKNEKYFVICYKNEKYPYSLHMKRTEIYQAFVILRDLMKTLNQSCVAIAGSKEIHCTEFEEFLGLINMTLYQ